MEGGQKQKISLESGLDVKSSDQLVPVEQPLFQHNRQRFQGSTLPTSLRFEHNGWACGWDVYEFEMDDASVSTVPEGYTVVKQLLNNNPTYILRIKKGSTLVAQIWHNVEDEDKGGGIEITHDANDYSIVTLSGENNGNAFEITVNLITGDISYDDANWLVSESSYFDAVSSRGEATLNVIDLNSWVQFNAAVMIADSIRYNGTELAAYSSLDGTLHGWTDTASNAWTVSFDEETGECLVNGEAAKATLDLSSGTLNIEHNASYNGTIDVTVSGESFYLQATDVYAKQSSEHISSSTSGSQLGLDKWELFTSGNLYLYPTSTTLPRFFLCASIPFWVGTRLSVSRNTSLSPTALSFANSSSDNETYQEYTSADSEVYIGRLCYVSSDLVDFYSESIMGGGAQLWIGDEESSAEHAMTTNTFDTGSDVSALLTYCVCVFNRIKAVLDEDGNETNIYDYPIRAGYGSEYVETVEEAAWLDGGTLEAKDGEEHEFLPGFYIEAAEVDGEWYIRGDKDSYPVAYEASEVIGEGSLVRLDAPYAYYDIPVYGQSWSSSALVSYASSESEAGAASVDLVLELSHTTYVSITDGKVHQLGELGYLLPYFRTTEDASDTRLLEGVSETGSGNNYGTVSLDVSSGPLAGFNVSMVVGVSSQTVTDSMSDLIGGTFTVIGLLGKGWIQDEIFRYSKSYAAQYNKYYSKFSSAKSAFLKEHEEDYPTDKYVYTYYWYIKSYGRSRTEVTKLKAVIVALNVSASVSYEGKQLLEYTSDNEADVTETMTDRLGITPKAAYALLSGAGDMSASSVRDSVFCLAVCFPGRMQSTLKLSQSDNGVITDSNLSSIVSLEPSLESDLVYTTGLYLDRAADNSTESYCSLFGKELLSLNTYNPTVSSGTLTIYCYVSPLMDTSNDYISHYLHVPTSSSEDDVFIPGNIYYGSAANAGSGHNMSGSRLGSSYAASSLQFNVSGTVSAFYMATSAYPSWIAESGAHEFHSDTLPSAVSLFNFVECLFANPSHLGNGTASIRQSIKFEFNGKEVLALITFSLANGVSSTSVEIDGDTVEAEYDGYTFIFSLGDYTWSSAFDSLDISVSVPLQYLLEGRLPYQYNYSDGVSYDSNSGKYTVDGVEMDAVPVGSFAKSYDHSTMTYGFESDGGVEYKYASGSETFSYGADTYEGEDAGDARLFTLDTWEVVELSLILAGPYKSSDGVDVTGFDGDKLSFTLDGTEYSFSVDELLNGVAKNLLTFKYTDTQDDRAVPEQIAFAVQDTTSEYQFLRQTWNTLVEVENYWWIDSNTILELNKTSLVVKRKVSSLDDYDSETDIDVDDWGGDAWENVASFFRGDYIDNTVARYGVTCAYGGAAPRFWTVKLYSSSKIQFNFYTLSEANGSYSLDGFSIVIPLNIVSIGSKLNEKEGSLNTYSQLLAESLIYEAKYSSTVVGEHILFGIHIDNNFNQWALDILTSGTLSQVVQGYGFVGLDGCLTGGEIPSDYFDPAIGFNDAVLPIDEIEQEDMEYVTTEKEFTTLEANGKVIGDESQQWYIKTQLSGIVSHLTWNGLSWDAVSLPITNTYSCVYGSPSYGRRVISDFAFWGQKLSQLINDSLFKSALSELMDVFTTKVYGYSPKITMSLYLQQTMGQYAYVHYNSRTPGKARDLTRENDSENIFEQSGDEGFTGQSYTALGMAQRMKPKEIEAITAENIDDFSFNLHGIRQSITVDNPWSGSFGISLLIINGMSSVITALSDTLSVNLRNNQVSASDMGRRFSQIFLQNMDNLATLDKTVYGTIPTLQSAVGATCTLDMFYSTCDGQQVKAGPGWVQHYLTAQCVAQSVTSCQWELQQIGMLWIVEGISSIFAKVAFAAAEAAWDLAIQVANATKEQWTTAVGSGTAYGWAIALLGVGIAGAIYAGLAVNKVIAEVTEAIVHSICGGNARVDMQNQASKHTYDVEGKHKYGDKSQIFMWPCFGVTNANTYTDERVAGVLTDHEWKLHVPLTSGQSYTGGTSSNLGTIAFDGVATVQQDEATVSSFNGDILYKIANCRGSSVTKTLPSDMAVITGSDSFLPPVPFRNENISASEPAFPTSIFQDYIIDKDWELSRTAGAGMTTWISCKDTKLIDGDVSNIVVSDDFCGVACPYTAIEVKRGCEQKYIRPWAVTPNALSLNQTGFNCCYDRKAYHAFDGYGHRYVKWCGPPGMNKEGRVWHYAFIVNDRFKRSNRMPVQELIGNFKGDPTIAFHTTGEDWVFNHVTSYVDGNEGGLEVGAIGEDKDSRRYAIPVFTEFVSSLPTTLKTTSSFNLSVIDGLTTLTSNNTDKQHAYKAPVSVDFAIGKSMFRFTNEYISQLEIVAGVTKITDLVPTLGLAFLGATPYEAYLYSPATRQYYTYSGGSSLQAVDTLERFRNVESGTYDFVQQEVAMPCVATFKRLDKHVHDDWDERDNRMVPRLKEGRFMGEVWPPIEPIYNNRSGFRLLSLPSGMCYQGPNRCIINRFVYSDYMKNQIIENYGKWKRVPREKYHPFRIYEAEYVRVDETVSSQIVGWTHNPFLLVTSPLGVNSETDCIFEWEVTFAWPYEMDELYDMKQYAVVNLWGECFTPGGKVIPDRPVHVFLWRDLFTRTGNYGYYSFRYQSRCGAGNRERLHIWSDQYIAVSGIQVEYKPVTEKRTEVLTQALDVQDMVEI